MADARAWQLLRYENAVPTGRRIESWGDETSAMYLEPPGK